LNLSCAGWRMAFLQFDYPLAIPDVG